MQPAEKGPGPAAGVEFHKMSGSGNDFVIFDGRSVDTTSLLEEPVIRAICHRREGVGADGVVILDPADGADFRMVYFNSDGSRASLCGNAALCSTALAARLGIASGSRMEFLTDAGRLSARLVEGVPEIDLQPVLEVLPDAGLSLEAGERRIGFAVAGVPHLVVLCNDADAIELERRGAALRHAPKFAEGANVNFVSPAPAGSWRMRTFERGVEGETLACGTGAVACALLLHLWNQPASAREGGARVLTSSGLPLDVRIRRSEDAGDVWHPSLRGEGRLVFRGQLGELRPAGIEAMRGR